MPQASNSHWRDDLPKCLIKQQIPASCLVRASLQLHQMISGGIIIMLFSLLYISVAVPVLNANCSLSLSLCLFLSLSQLFNVYTDKYFLSSFFLSRSALQSCPACEIPSLMLMVASIKCAQSDWNISFSSPEASICSP